MVWSKQERALFRTHDAPFNRPEWQVGELLDHDGKVYQVTKWLELPPVRLHRGGSVKEWEVWGRRVSDKEIRDTVERAASDLLDRKDY